MTMDEVTITIEEMALIIYKSDNALLWHDCVIAATNLYNAGFRQESEVVKETVDRMVENFKNRIKDKFSYHGWYLNETIIEQIAKEIKGE